MGLLGAIPQAIQQGQASVRAAKLGAHQVQQKEQAIQREIQNQAYTRHMEQGKMIVDMGQNLERGTPEWKQSKGAFEGWAIEGLQRFQIPIHPEMAASMGKQREKDMGTIYPEGATQGVYGERTPGVATTAPPQPERQATTPLGDFMQDNPDATPQEIKAFQTAIRPDPQMTKSERELDRQQKFTVKLSPRATKEPNKVYSEGYQMNEDGTLFIDPFTNTAVKLPPFNKVLKRGAFKEFKATGELWDDTKEINALLNDPEVKANLQMADKEGLWDRALGTWSNKISRWLLEKGMGKNSKTSQAIVRMQRLASSERKLYFGTAVTDQELRTALSWLPAGGDSYSEMQVKMGVASSEGEEVFKRYLDLYKNVANMTPFYDAFGLQRFEQTGGAGDIESLAKEFNLEMPGAK